MARLPADSVALIQQQLMRLLALAPFGLDDGFQHNEFRARIGKIE